MYLKPYPHKTGKVVRWLFPNFLWFKEIEKPTLYLTFDDGPIKGVTEEVLHILKDYEAKATFFCIGKNINENPKVFEKIIDVGHSVGNHTQNHLNGWKNETSLYLENVRQCQQTLEASATTLSNSDKPLFRPPYGRMKPEQVQLIQKDFQIVMWDVLTGDFDKFLSRHVCLQKSIDYSESGSIITFHDSIKASKNLFHTLPRYLEYFSKLGYSFDRI